MYRYAAIASTSVDEDGDVKVTFLRCQCNSAKMFKIEENVLYIAFHQIVKILSIPQSHKKGRGNFYYFQEDIDIFEK